MTKRYMLDTNIVISFLKNKSPALIARINETVLDDLCISVITEHELHYGLNKNGCSAHTIGLVNLFIDTITVESYDERSQNIYGVLRAELERREVFLNPLGVLIAGHAKALDCTLVTRDNAMQNALRQYMDVEDWTVP